MNTTLITITLDKNTNITIEKSTKEIAVCFGEDMVYMSNDLSEKLFQELDKALHEETMQYDYIIKEFGELEDKLFCVTDDLEKATETLEYKRELEEERNNRSFMRQRLNN